MNTAALRYELLKHIDSIVFSVKHATNIEIVLRECLSIELDDVKCMGYDYVTKLVSSLENKQLIIPTQKGLVYHRVNLPLLLYAIKHDKNYYINLYKAVTKVVESRVLAMLVAIMPPSLLQRRKYVSLMVSSVLAKVVFPHLKISDTSSVLYLDNVPYDKSDLEILEKYFDEADGNVYKFWLGYLSTYVLQRKFSENVLSLRMKRSYVADVANIINSNLRMSVDCRPPGYHFFLDIVFDLARYLYVHKVWPEVTLAFEVFTEFCANKLKGE